jgi:hypothetical protein
MLVAGSYLVRRGRRETANEPISAERLGLTI